MEDATPEPPWQSVQQPTRRDRERERFLAGLDAADLGRIRVRGRFDLAGADPHVAPPASWWEALRDAADPVRTALLGAEAAWPGRWSPRQAAFVRRNLVPLALARLEGDGTLVVHPELLVAAAAELDAATDAAWAVRHTRSLAEAAALWVGVRVADAGVGSRLALAADPPPSLAFRRWVGEDEGDDVAMESLAGALRAAALEALDAGGPEEALTWLRDAPAGRGPASSCCLPATLLLGAHELVERAVVPSPQGVPEASLARRAAAAWAKHGGAWDLPARVGVGSPALRALRARHAPGRSAEQVLAWMRGRGRAEDRRDTPTRACLVDRPVAADLQGSWLDVSVAASRDDLTDVVLSLLGEGTDWFEFDAPGEGELPRLWASALVVAEAWERLSGAFRSAGGEALVAEVDSAPWALLAAWPSPGALRGGASAPEADALTGVDAQGLVDGIAEAYGDVWSPHDPFSERSAPRPGSSTHGDGGDG